LEQNNKPVERVIRRSLQAAVAIFSWVPILAGLAGILLGPGMVEAPGIASMSMDSHFRYLSGLLMGIGFGFLSCISRIESKTARFQLLTGIVILGGLGRLYSLIMDGVPDRWALFGLGMELIVTPLLALGQWHIKNHGAIHPRQPA
jgi:hypothetical protein